MHIAVIEEFCPGAQVRCGTKSNLRALKNLAPTVSGAVPPRKSVGGGRQRYRCSNYCNYSTIEITKLDSGGPAPDPGPFATGTSISHLLSNSKIYDSFFMIF